MSVHRRGLLTRAGVLGAGLAASFEDPACAAPTPVSTLTASTDAEPALALNLTEVAFVAAAVDTLIPADHLSPSGSDCGVAAYIDRQLAGAWGGGARLYRDGPYLKGKPEHGYQSPLTPKAYFTAGVAAVNAWIGARYGRPFDALAEADRVAVLRALETGEATLTGIGAADFFAMLLALTMEGFFADPIYGGNRGKAGWAMVGYPGLPATYREAIVSHRGEAYRVAPQSIADFS
jgi:gluconate 2-dehydrogenase gamma chain